MGYLLWTNLFFSCHIYIEDYAVVLRLWNYGLIDIVYQFVRTEMCQSSCPLFILKWLLCANDARSY